MNEELVKLMGTIRANFIFIHKILDNQKLNFNDDYKKINYAYYNVFCAHYESFFILIYNNNFSSAILLLRTMLELYVKSYYLEFIEKEKNTNILQLIDGEEDFPSFFKMLKDLESYKDKSGAKFEGVFIQFSKSELASYEKFSLFSHGKGEYLRTIFENNKISYSNKQISDVVKTAKGLFETLSLLLMYTHSLNDEVKEVIKELQEAL